MNCPGFAILALSRLGKISVVDKRYVDNSRRKTHSAKLMATVNGLKAMLSLIPEGSKVCFVRERGFSRFAHETQTLMKVVGVSDYVLAKEIIGTEKYRFETPNDSWIEIAPGRVKLIVAGYGRATKADVQASLAAFVGPMKYARQDESDAVAVGVAYLMEQKLGRTVPEVSRKTFVPKNVKKSKRKLPPKIPKEEKVKVDDGVQEPDQR